MRLFRRASTSLYIPRRGWSEASSAAYITHALKVLELRRDSAAHKPKEIQLFVQHAPARCYGEWRRLWHQRLATARGYCRCVA